MTKQSIWIGYDSRETTGFAVAKHSIERHLSEPIEVYGLVLPELQAAGLYRRPTKAKVNSEGRRQLVDELSARPDYDGSMSTEFAISRFLTPHLARTGWALFMDSDVLARRDLAGLFAAADETKAVMCVQHDYNPSGAVKMDGQVQSRYARKNWSSVVIFNCDHPANARLTVDMVNTLPGRDLHAFCWLEDELIGALDVGFNYLVGHSSGGDPSLVHFTSGLPDMPGYENQEYADEWRAEVPYAVGALRRE